MYNRPYKTEVPLRGFEQVLPAAKVENLADTTIALFTTGGLVPVGNPDKLKQAFSVNYGKYSIEGLDELKKVFMSLSMADMIQQTQVMIHIV